MFKPHVRCSLLNRAPRRRAPNARLQSRGAYSAVRFRAKREPLEGFTWKPRPESGLDCLVCAIFVRQRTWQPGPMRVPRWHGPYLLDRVYEIVSQMSIPEQICELVLYNSTNEGLKDFCENGILQNNLINTLCEIRPSTRRPYSAVRFRATREQLEMLLRLLPGSQGQNLAVNDLYLPYQREEGTADKGPRT